MRNVILVLGMSLALHADAATPIASLLETTRAERPDAPAAIPPVLQSLAAADRRAGPRDRVLNQMQASVLAFQLGEYGYALPLLMDAHAQIETIYANDEVATKARSKFVPDASKEFKGDAYERAMLGYYLGLSYMMKGDLENARASFRWGEFQDTMSANESYQSDMSGLTFLKGWAAKCQGDNATGNEEISAARRARETLIAPTGDDDLLVIVETGSSPIKVTSGKYNENLSFRRGAASAADSILVSYAGHWFVPAVAEDVYWQASTLGGRAVDKILAGKASFKQGAETTAEVADSVTQVGLQVAQQASFSGNLDMANMAGGMAAASLLVGIGAKIFAAKTKPTADSRYWSNLPDRVLFGVAKFSNESDGTVTFRSAGQEIGSQSFTIRPTGSCYIAWIREGVSTAPREIVQEPTMVAHAAQTESLSSSLAGQALQLEQDPPPAMEAAPQRRLSRRERRRMQAEARAEARAEAQNVDAPPPTF